MKHRYPLPIYHSWALYEQARHFALGQLHGYDSLDAEPVADAIANVPKPGEWACDLRDNSLSWSSEIYDIFGLPDGAALSRDEAVGFYCEGSRAAMERLRAYAIKHRRGFTLDAEIRPGQGDRRWMRLIAVPVCVGGEVVKLEGLKFVVPGGR